MKPDYQRYMLSWIPTHSITFRAQLSITMLCSLSEHQIAKKTQKKQIVCNINTQQVDINYKRRSEIKQKHDWIFIYSFIYSFVCLCFDTLLLPVIKLSFRHHERPPATSQYLWGWSKPKEMLCSWRMWGTWGCNLAVFLTVVSWPDCCHLYA